MSFLLSCGACSLVEVVYVGVSYFLWRVYLGVEIIPSFGGGTLLLSLISFSILCSVWEEMNVRVFMGSSHLVEDVMFLVLRRIAKWASRKKGFDNLKVYGILHNWEASVSNGFPKKCILQVWVPPLVVELKFNVNGASRGKPGLARVGGVLRNSHGVLLVLFSKHVTLVV